MLWLVRWRHAGRPSWALPLYAGLGAGLGLVVHPAFPANLELWVAQNVHLFDFVGSLGAGGAELRPATTLELLAKNFGFWAAAALALLAARGAAPAPPERALARDVYAVAALAFGALYLAMWRFGLYFFPFAALALLAALGPEGLRTRFRLPAARRTLPLAFAWLLCVVAALPQASAMARRFLDRAMPGPPREEAWRAFAASVPDGAKIAAPWGIAQAYVFFAPQGRYLNLLDPLLMALPYPREEALARALFAGEEPDLALAVGAGLDSDYLAFSTAVDSGAARGARRRRPAPAPDPRRLRSALCARARGRGALRARLGGGGARRGVRPLSAPYRPARARARGLRRRAAGRTGVRPLPPARVGGRGRPALAGARPLRARPLGGRRPAAGGARRRAGRGARRGRALRGRARRGRARLDARDLPRSRDRALRVLPARARGGRRAGRPGAAPASRPAAHQAPQASATPG